MDMANIIGCQREGADRSASATASRGRGRSVRQHLRNSCRDEWMDGEGGVSGSTLQLVLTYRIFLLQVLPDLSAIIHQRDALEVENDRLRTFLGLAD